MDTLSSINNAKMPAPNLSNTSTTSSNTSKTKREIKRPNVGVVNAPSLSSTPINDWVELKKEQNPRMAYKITEKSKVKGMKLQTFLSIGTIVCGLIALIKGKKVNKRP